MNELKIPAKLVRKDENARARTVRYVVNPEKSAPNYFGHNIVKKANFRLFVDLFDSNDRRELL